jgi:hypothetical protein
MVDKISQNLKYSESAGVMCRKGALSVARLGEDAGKYAIAMQLSDYQAFTPPPQLLDNQAVTCISNCRFQRGHLEYFILFLCLSGGEKSVFFNL